MPGNIPFKQSLNNYRIIIPINVIPYLIDVRFNSVDNAWYLDLREEDETLILGNIKVVLGSRIGRTSAHPFFASHLISVIDTSASSIDARFDDLGGRVQVQIVDISEVIV